MRPLQRTGVVSNTPAAAAAAAALTAHSSAAAAEDGGGAQADVPEGLRPFCRPDVDGRVLAMVHENQARLSMKGVVARTMRVRVGTCAVLGRRSLPSAVLTNVYRGGTRRCIDTDQAATKHSIFSVNCKFY